MVKSRAWLEVDLTAVKANLNAIRKLVFPSKVLACVKANAYGLGACRLAPYIEEDANIFGVASVSEGMELRQAGVQKEILVLGLTPEEDIQEGLEENLTLTVADRKTAEAISKKAAVLGRKVRVHIKIDTGMGRLGLRPEEYPGFHNWCRRLSWLEISGVFTHFPIAETRNRFTLKQIEKFREVTNPPTFSPTTLGHPPHLLGGRAYGAPDLSHQHPPQGGRVMRHAANSAAIFNYPESYFDLVRPGLALYGALPFQPAGTPYASFLKPAVTLGARIIFIKWLKKGESVSYGRTFRAKKKTRVATVSIGYADGYGRCLSGRSEVLVSGRRCPVIGAVCMDMLMVDISGVKDVAVGDEVILLGKQGKEQIRVEEISGWAGTVEHEILSRLGARLTRIYKD